jgi:hypothetical protein
MLATETASKSTVLSSRKSASPSRTLPQQKSGNDNRGNTLQSSQQTQMIDSSATGSDDNSDHRSDHPSISSHANATRSDVSSRPLVVINVDGDDDEEEGEEENDDSVRRPTFDCEVVIPEFDLFSYLARRQKNELRQKFGTTVNDTEDDSNSHTDDSGPIELIRKAGSQRPRVSANRTLTKLRNKPVTQPPLDRAVKRPGLRALHQHHVIDSDKTGSDFNSDHQDAKEGSSGSEASLSSSPPRHIRPAQPANTLQQRRTQKMHRGQRKVIRHKRATNKLKSTNQRDFSVRRQGRSRLKKHRASDEDDDDESTSESDSGTSRKNRQDINQATIGERAQLILAKRDKATDDKTKKPTKVRFQLRMCILK